MSDGRRTKGPKTSLVMDGGMDTTSGDASVFSICFDVIYTWFYLVYRCHIVSNHSHSHEVDDGVMYIWYYGAVRLYGSR